MKCLFKITDDDFGIKTKKIDNYNLRLSSRGIIIRSDGKIAIQHKTKKHQFKLIGGGVELNENIVDAFKREVLEEAGCKIEIIEQLGVTEEYKQLHNSKQISHIFVARVINDNNQLNLTKREKDEGSILLWVEPKEALALLGECYNKIILSDKEDDYDVKFLLLRDKKILEYYLEKK